MRPLNEAIEAWRALDASTREAFYLHLRDEWSDRIAEVVTTVLKAAAESPHDCNVEARWVGDEKRCGKCDLLLNVVMPDAPWAAAEAEDDLASLPPCRRCGGTGKSALPGYDDAWDELDRIALRLVALKAAEPEVKDWDPFGPEDQIPEDIRRDTVTEKGWAAEPEAQCDAPQMTYYSPLCARCGCPSGAHGLVLPSVGGSLCAHGDECAACSEISK